MTRKSLSLERTASHPTVPTDEAPVAADTPAPGRRRAVAAAVAAPSRVAEPAGPSPAAGGGGGDVRRQAAASSGSASRSATLRPGDKIKKTRRGRGGGGGGNVQGMARQQYLGRNVKVQVKGEEWRRPKIWNAHGDN